MKRLAERQYGDFMSWLHPEWFNKNKLFDENGSWTDKYFCRTVVFQVTDDCNLRCKYCYQGHKGKKYMTFDTAKKLVDAIFEGGILHDQYGYDKTPAIAIEFIGGEPFLNINLIEQVCDYFVEKAFNLCHPWAKFHRFSITSNGTLYFNEDVQRFINKYKNELSMGITIDGNKELHDSCRVFPNGDPSYDLAIAAARDWFKRIRFTSTKITISPDNLDYLVDAIINMINLGYKDIRANTVFEKGWNNEHAKKFYIYLKKLADYLLDNDLEDVYISLFDKDIGDPLPEEENRNWCGGTGMMLAMDPDGYLYPCIRYMESSLNGEQKPLSIGHVDIGIDSCGRDCINCLSNITRRSQSTDECFYCPIGKGCAWCSAYNYQVNGTADKRATFICEMHKARVLATVYYWNKYYIKHDINEVKILNCPKEWALNIIDESEYNLLYKLSRRHIKTTKINISMELDSSYSIEDIKKEFNITNVSTIKINQDDYEETINKYTIDNSIVESNNKTIEVSFIKEK